MFGKRYENDAPEKVRQVLFTEKHPPARLRPLANVLVAVPVCAKLSTERPPEKVEVPAPVTKRDGVERTPVAAMEVVPVEPNAAVLARTRPENSLVDVALVAINPPLKVFVFVNVFAEYVFGIVDDESAK